MFKRSLFDVKRYVRNLENPRSVDISDLTGAYNNSKIALDMALDYGSTVWHGDLFRNIVAEFKYNQAGSFGIYKPSEDFLNRDELINLVYKDKDNLNKNIYGVSFGINIQAIIRFWQNKVKKIYGAIWNEDWFKKLQDPILHYHIILEVAATMVHEARHALLREYGGKLVPGSESDAKKAEKDFLKWMMLDRRKLQLMKDLGIPSEYKDLIADPTV